MRTLLFLVAVSAWAQQDDAFARHAASAAAALQSGDYAAAERENREVLRLDPNLPEAEMNLGISCFLEKKYQSAIEAFETGLKQKPEMSNARLFLGISHFNLNETAKALPFLQRYTAEKPDDFQGQYYLGLTDLGLNRSSDAEHALLAARRLEPRNIDVLYHLAQTYVGEARQSPRAQAQLAAAYSSAFAEIEAIDPSSFRLAQLRAAFYESKGEKGKAMAELETLFQHDPHARGLHYTLGCLYLEAEEYPQALAQFEAELELDNPEPRTYLQLGHTYIAMSKPQQALPYLQKAVIITPDSAGVAWVDIGRAYRQLEQPIEATAAFERGIKLGERKANVYYQLSLVARKSGDLSRARDALAISQRLRDEEKHPLPGPGN
ncbi:MAG TPA: tetratricopeptide repeat protein [Bryobacteraceae bacterium]|jgi:tetratricopeptide (TPR) repeat protein|nr:tetratricopeptide repeat protein [Bryobacteraceae bacterium]